MVGRKKGKKYGLVRSYVVDKQVDDYLEEAASIESEAQDRNVSKSEMLRTIVRTHQDVND